jgi:transposase-like protein
MWITQLCFALVQRYAPEINKRVCQHLKMSGTSYRVDETYILRREDM